MWNIINYLIRASILVFCFQTGALALDSVTNPQTGNIDLIGISGTGSSVPGCSANQILYTNGSSVLACSNSLRYDYLSSGTLDIGNGGVGTTAGITINPGNSVSGTVVFANAAVSTMASIYVTRVGTDDYMNIDSLEYLTISNSSVSISGASITIGNVTSGSSAADFDDGGNYTGGDGQTQIHKYRIYAYKTSGGATAFSTTYYEIDNTEDDGTHIDAAYTINVSWTAVSGATGYRIIKYHDFDGSPTLNFSAYYDVVGTNTFADVGPDTLFTHGQNVLPTTNYSNTITLNGQISNTYGNITHYGTYEFNDLVDFNTGLTIGGENFVTIDNANANFFMGQNSGANNTVGGYKFGAGIGTLQHGQDDFYNVAVGPFALNLNVSGQYITAVGAYAGYNSLGGNNSFFGYHAGYVYDLGAYGTFLGANAGVSATTAYGLIAIGAASASGITTAQYSIGIGLDTINGNYGSVICLGHGAQATAANQFIVGRQGITEIRTMYFGGGVTDTDSSHIQTLAYRTTGGSGSNISAWSVAYYPGIATGSATPATQTFYGTEVLGSGSTAQTAYSRLAISGTELVINDDSRVFDTRIETDGNANTFFVKGSNDRVGILTNAPTDAFSIATKSDWNSSGLITKYNNIATAGLGSPAIYSESITATKTGNFTVLAYTPPATAGRYRISGVITTTSSTNTGTVQFTLDYKDSQGITHTADIIPLVDAAGAIATTKSGASLEFHSIPWEFSINNAATVINLKVVITGTVSYTAAGTIEQIA